MNSKHILLLLHLLESISIEPTSNQYFTNAIDDTFEWKLLGSETKKTLFLNSMPNLVILRINDFRIEEKGHLRSMFEQSGVAYPPLFEALTL